MCYGLVYVTDVKRLERLKNGSGIEAFGKRE